MLLKPRTTPVPAQPVAAAPPPSAGSTAASIAPTARPPASPTPPASAPRPPAASSAPVAPSPAATAPVVPVVPAVPAVPAASSAGALAQVARPADLPAYIDVVAPGEFAGVADNVKADGLQLPLIYLQQPLSKPVVEGRLRAGDVVLSSDPESRLFGVGDRVAFVPFFAFREWIEWRHRDLGGGLLAREKDSRGELARKFQQQWRERPAGGAKPTAEQQPTRVEEYYVILALFEGALDEPVAFPLGKTKYKKGRALLTLARKRAGVPLYGGKYTVHTALEQAKQGGFQYYNFEFEMAGNPSAEEYARAKAAAQAAKEGFDAITLSLEEKDDEPADAEIVPAGGGANPGY